MKATLLSTTNPAADDIVNKECILHIDMTASFTFDSTECNFDLRYGRYRTSIIHNVDYEETSRNCYKITITTRNSVYVFQNGEESNEKPLTSDELLAMQLTMFL